MYPFNGKSIYELDKTSNYNLTKYAEQIYEAEQKIIYGELLYGKMNLAKDSREQLATTNPWVHIAKEIEANDYKNPEYSVHPEDKQIVEEFNAVAKDDHRLILNLPPEPFQGNPLDAKVVILTLNPGYVVDCNLGKYELLEESEQKKFIMAKCRTMSMQDDLCIPTMIYKRYRGTYWERKLKSVLDIPGGNHNIAIIQFLGYFFGKVL